MIGSSFGPVLDLRIVDGKLQMLREEQELFILEPPVSVPPSPFAKRAPKQVWRDVDEILRDGVDLDKFYHLRRTIGNAQWIDNLDGEQWRVLTDEIMPVFRKAEKLRSAVSEAINE